MKNYLNINQKAVYECGLQNDIDFIDLIILAVVRNLISMSDSEIIVKDNTKYHWVSHGHVSNELPLLKLKKDAIYRRIMKFCDLGLLIQYGFNKTEKRSYYAITKKYDSLFVSNIDDIGSKATTSGQEPKSTSGVEPMEQCTILEPLKEINKESFDLFLEMVNRVTSKKYRGDTKSKRNFLARVKQGYKIEDMEKALKAAMHVKTHVETKFMYLTPEFITRPDKLETYLNAFKEEKQGMSNEAYREFVGLNN